jgi:prevent-host-death family protein
MQYTIGEAKTQFAALIKRTLAGEEISVANRNRPLVKIASVQEDLSNLTWKRNSTTRNGSSSVSTKP